MNIARKGGALSDDLPEAISVLTGEQFWPNMRDERWRELVARIDGSPYTAFEYVYYVAHHEDVNGLTGSHNLVKKNFVCHENTWDRFLEFKNEFLHKYDQNNKS